MTGETSTQYVAYTLYKADPAWLRLPIEERNAGKEAFAEVVAAWQERTGKSRRAYYRRQGELGLGDA